MTIKLFQPVYVGKVVLPSFCLISSISNHLMERLFPPHVPSPLNIPGAQFLAEVFHLPSPSYVLRLVSVDASPDQLWLKTCRVKVSIYWNHSSITGIPLTCMFQLLEDYQTTGQYSTPIATKI